MTVLTGKRNIFQHGGHCRRFDGELRSMFYAARVCILKLSVFQHTEYGMRADTKEHCEQFPIHLIVMADAQKKTTTKK